MAEQFRTALTKSSFGMADKAVVANQFQILGERKIEAGELLAVGYGSESGQNNAQGRIFIDIKNNAASPGAALEGTVRLQVYSPQNRPLVILGEWRTETLRTGSGDRTKQIPFPENMYWISEDKKLVLEFAPDSAGTVGLANSTILIDATEETV